MNYTVAVATKDDLPWLCSRANAKEEGIWALKAMDSNWVIKGMMGLETVTPNMTMVHMAFDEPMAARALLPPICQIGFKRGRYGLATIPGYNEKSIRFAKKAGFREVSRIRDGWSPGIDMVTLILDRAECRFLSQDERKVA